MRLREKPGNAVSSSLPHLQGTHGRRGRELDTISRPSMTERVVEYKRPDPDALLADVQRQQQRAARGKLKVFFGAAPGVGKTFAMLEEGRARAAEGMDVVVGYAEPHA